MTTAQAIIIATMAGNVSIMAMAGQVVNPLSKQEEDQAKAVLGYDDFYKYYDQAVDAAMGNI